jgi:hypothetical protein
VMPESVFDFQTIRIRELLVRSHDGSFCLYPA